MRLPLATATPAWRPVTRIVTLCLVALLATSALAPTAAASRKLALGVSMLKDRDIATYEQFKQDSGGRAPALWSIWSDWGSSVTGDLPLTFMAHLKANGTVPIILWQPVNTANIWDRSYSYKRIANGDYDEYIETFAGQVKAYGGRVLIRFAHEFDGGWFPWGVGKPGNSIKDFRRAWRHVFRIFRDREDGLAKKARFVWSPQGSRGASWMKEAFPGKEYVDYLGFTAFNWAGFKDLKWRSLSSAVTRRLKLFVHLPRKPFIIAETGSHHRPGSKADWLRNGYEAVYRKWPRIVAISYFNVDMRQSNDAGHDENWSLDRPTDGSAMKAYRALLRKTKFRGTIP